MSSTEDAMVTVDFARAFRRHVDCPRADVPGRTVGDALAAYFAAAPMVRSYVLDDQGAVRKHVVVFVNSEQLGDRTTLSDMVGDGDIIHIFQALSGG
jgi:sulfur-carrier protein